MRWEAFNRHTGFTVSQVSGCSKLPRPMLVPTADLTADRQTPVC